MLEALSEAPNNITLIDNASKLHEKDALSNLILVLILMGALFLAYIVSSVLKISKYLPESGAAMIFGKIV